MIVKTSLFYKLLGESYGGSIKMVLINNIEPDILKKLEECGLYDVNYDDGDMTIVTNHMLSVNIFEYMGSPVEERELSKYVESYFQTSGMWPMIKSPQEIAQYSLNYALPEFIKAGLLSSSPAV